MLLHLGDSRVTGRDTGLHVVVDQAPRRDQGRRGCISGQGHYYRVAKGLEFRRRAEPVPVLSSRVRRCVCEFVAFTRGARSLKHVTTEDQFFFIDTYTAQVRRRAT